MFQCALQHKVEAVVSVITVQLLLHAVRPHTTKGHHHHRCMHACTCCACGRTPIECHSDLGDDTQVTTAQPYGSATGRPQHYPSPKHLPVAPARRMHVSMSPLP
jgi:hypothetical protein